MRLIHISVFAALAAGCGGNSTMTAEQFDTFQACYDEHHTTEALSTQCAIEICCIDHPIGAGATKANIVCGDTAATCESYVTSNLTDSADTTLQTDVQTACQNYTVDGQHGGTGSGGMCSG
jgi:hypothetical protein